MSGCHHRAGPAPHRWRSSPRNARTASATAPRLARPTPPTGPRPRPDAPSAGRSRPPPAGHAHARRPQLRSRKSYGTPSGRTHHQQHTTSDQTVTHRTRRVEETIPRDHRRPRLDQPEQYDHGLPEYLHLVFLLSIDDATQLDRLNTASNAQRNEAQRAQIINGRPIFEQEMKAAGALIIDGRQPIPIVASRIVDEILRVSPNTPAEPRRRTRFS